MEHAEAETPLNQFRLAETSDVGEFEESIRPIYGEVRFDRANPLNEFKARANYRVLDHSDIYYGHYGTRVKNIDTLCAFYCPGRNARRRRHCYSSTGLKELSTIQCCRMPC